MSLLPIYAAVLVAASDTDSVAVRRPTMLEPQPVAVTMAPDTQPRRRAIEYSDWYARRLTTHRYGSYVMLPLFATQFVLGNSMLKQKQDLEDGTRRIPVDEDLRRKHRIVAAGVGTLFLVNTTTGVWNLYESRSTPEGRGRRTMHALAMVAADAGFVTTGVLAKNAVNRGPDEARTHRNVALASMGVATVSASMMLFLNRH